MSKTEASSQKRRKLALIGLHSASGKKKSTSCPASEELAAFVDKPVSPKERKRITAHLLSCESCYQEWLELTSLKRSDGRRISRASLLMRPKILTTLGTGLAAAACILLFLHTPTKQLQRPQPATDSVMEREAQPLSSPAPVAEPELLKKSPSAPRAEEQDVTAPELQMMDKVDEDMSAPSGEGMNSSQKNLTRKKETRATLSPYDSYYANLMAICARTAPFTAETLQQQTSRLLQESTLSEGQRQLLQKIAQLLKNPDLAADQNMFCEGLEQLTTSSR